MSGFGKHAGPAAPPSSQPQFGNFGRPPSPSPQPPPFRHSAPGRSPSFDPRGPVALERVQSPPLAYESSGLAASAFPSAGIPRKYQSIEAENVLGPKHTSSPQWANGSSSFSKDDDKTNLRASAVTSFVTSRNSENSITAKISRFQELKRYRSPPSHASEEEISRNSSRPLLDYSDLHVDNGSHLVPTRTRSPPFPFENQNSIEYAHPSSGEGQWSTLPPSGLDSQHKLPNRNPNLLAHQHRSPFSPYLVSYASPRNEVVDIHVPKQSSSPAVPPANEVFQKESISSSTSPPRLGAKSDAFPSPSDSQIPQRTFQSLNDSAVKGAPSRTTNYTVAKRTRSPPLAAADKFFQGNSFSTEDGTEREIQAKAKRLARFKEESSENFENKSDISDHKSSASSHEQSVERQKFAGSHSMVSAGDFTDGISSDFEGFETSSIIVGLCPDMCPESERGERERKGDLDQYERLDGDRNQTSKFLAIKKYNRTAERDENLIRPMPVLQKTIDYLLGLLDQPYDDRFLGIYNFLWDRMRAVRMDLRMQHIFNQEAITMLEQMIRLHIIAMHELCEYTKGEGFSEGFDAHLNIEQMNKTSVDLFQMYDDHRKKGINVPTEKEFRGYYALLKLDKHPGYKVEPVELSLDLAKMSPEIRQTPDVLFARDVARACRMGNFVTFFRLARKATYLQACLIHAHFAKLRTQALASLHSGLQNNQGLPVAHVAKWLAMEEEDIRSLLEYHGFAIKEFEEEYMVKEGPFLNVDQDYPTKCSKLVQLKKSRTIVEDVSSASQVVFMPPQVSKEIQFPMICKHESKAVCSAFANIKSSYHELDEEMPDFEVITSPKVRKQLQPKIDQQSQEEHLVESAHVSSFCFSPVHSHPVSQLANLKDVEKPNDGVVFSVSSEEKMLSSMDNMPLQVVSRTAFQESSPSAKNVHALGNPVPCIVVSNKSKDKEPPEINQAKENEEVMENYNDEVAEAKLKLIIRLWRRHSVKRRELREQRQMVATAALSSLSLGPPIRKAKDQLSTASEFDIEHVMRERYDKHKKSWSRLNVSDVIADILCIKNPDIRCVCWKIVLCYQIKNQGDKAGQRSQVMHAAAAPWLLSKIMPSKKDDYDDDNLLISSSGLSIWKKWVPNQSGNNLTCCLSVVRDVTCDGLNVTINGASAILFLISATVPWNMQKVRLQNLLLSIPSGSSLPLLVLCGSYNKEFSDPTSVIISELGLHDIDKSRVSSFSVVFLTEDKERECLGGFFSDVRLREGLQWLASESPLQPDIHCMRTHELILTHLNPSLDVLEKMNERELVPDHCISTFNEALDWLLGEIVAAAKSNPTSWPCSEIDLLQDSCDEHMLLKCYLPNVGWSSAARIEPLLSAIKECRLPTFPDAVSWSDKGANSGDEIENLRSQLENCLIRYLTQSSGMMTVNLAIKEAHVMLQKSARLELRGSSYYIVPKWISVFRRIFNWRLTSLFNGALSSAYVFRHHHVNPTSYILDEFGLKGNVSSPYISRPSLDEIIVSSAPLLTVMGQPQLEAFEPPLRTASSSNILEAAKTNDLVDCKRTSAQLVKGNVDCVTRGLITTGAEAAGKPTKETDRLSKLLEKCNIVQNAIDDKLYIYF